MLQFIPLDQIQVAKDRQRRFFDPDKLADLQASIETNGLLQPIILREGNHLVCGERRLKALEAIYLMNGEIICGGAPVPANHAPCLYIGDLSPADAFEAELDENIRRQDLTWQEHAEAVERLHTIRLAQDIHHTVAETAKEVHERSDGYFQEAVRKQIIVAKHLDKPEVAKAKSVDEAFKVLQRQERDNINKLRGAEMQKVTAKDKHVILKGDCLEWLQGMEPNLFDCIITDPPYGMGADTFGDAGGKQVQTHDYEDSLANFQSLMLTFSKESFRVTKKEAHLFLWCDIENYPYLRNLFKGVGWNVHRTPIIYLKPDGNRVPWPKIGLQRKYEVVLFAEKGGKPLNTVTGDYFSASGDSNLGHGAQKPVAAYAEILKRSCRAGDRVLDAFAGSGPLLPAAHEANCRATLIEQSEQAFGIIAQRLENLK